MSERWVTIGSFYCKPTAPLDPLLEILQQTLQELQTKHPNDALILGGDFNASIADLNDELPFELVENSQVSATRRMMVSKSDSMGLALMEFMSENGLCLLNGRTRSDSPGKFSSTAGVSTLNLIWIGCDDLDLV